MNQRNLKNRSIPFLMLLCIMLSINALGQRKEISVNHFTGTPNVSLPLFTVTSGSIVFPIGVSYSTNGVKPTDLDGPMGLTWQLTADGEITRVLRGLPDDCQKDNATTPNARLGWLYNSNGSKINSFAISNDNSTETCPDETTDLNFINSNFSDLSDTEPDQFYVNAPGLSCQLSFDNNKNIKISPYKDLNISYTTDPTSGLITSFTIINDKGLKYIFSSAESATRKASSSSPSAITHLKRDYDYYVNGITYNIAWKLTSITDINGNSISLMYSYGGEFPNSNISTINDWITTFSGTAGGSSVANKQYLVTTTFTPKRIFSISCSDGITTQQKVVFTFKDFSVDAFGYPVVGNYNTPILTSITGFGKTFYFNYTNISGFRRFLSSIQSTTQQGIDPHNYNFSYTNISIPDSSTMHLDIWGFYNANGASTLNPKMYVNPSTPSFERYRPIVATNNSGSYPYILNGADRSANTAVVDYGSLNRVTFPDGGAVSFSYESNDYYDNTASAVIQGGGIRIKQITYEDGVSSANNIVRNFAYLNPATAQSSGKPISMPVFAYITPYTSGGSEADLWNYSTVRSERNLTSEDNSIIYSHVKESRSGAGSTLYEFTIPATAWDATASPDWNAITNYFARTSCVSAGFMKTDINTYPFAPNINYDFERGLIKKVTNSNEAGAEVSSVSYTYQRLATPEVTTGLKFGDNGIVKSYAKYPIYTSTGELLIREERKVYDSQTLSQAQATSIDYSYSPVHKSLIQQQVTNSDGTIQRNVIKYLKDYDVSTGSDANVIAMRNLKQLYVNIPVEKYFQVERSGVNKTVGAELIKFNTFNAQGIRTLYLPSQSLRLVSGDGIPSFQPSIVTSGIYSNDPNYVVTGNILAYDFSGFPLSTDDNNKNIQSVLTDHDNFLPVASIKNARYDEIAYNDFNSNIRDCGFVRQSGTNTYSTNSRSGQYSLSLEALMPMSKTVIKNNIAKNYIFSIWFNSSSSGTITVILPNGNYNLTIPNSNGTWMYRELKVPLTGIGSTFNAQFQSSIAVLVDDIFFYPEIAEVSTVAYDKITNNKAAETNSNGVSNYYSYDTFGRLKLAYDQDKQIVLKNTYVAPNSFQYFGTPSISYSGSIIKGTAITFTASAYNTPYNEGLTYTWNFGDGTAPVTTTTISSPAHTYSSTGNYTVTLTATSPVYGSKSSTTIITVNPPPAQPITVSYANYTTGLKYSLTRVEFYEGSTLKYNFTDVQLSSGQTILQGNYTVKVYFNRVLGFRSITVDQGTGDWCFPTSGVAPSPNTSTLNLTNSPYLRFSSSSGDCLL